MGIAIFSEGFPSDSIFKIATCEEEWFANSFEGIPEVVIFSDDIFWKRAYFVEGSSGVEICSIDNEQEDFIIVKNTGVEGVKGMSFFDSSK